LPPQPLAWFRNALECLGDRILIRIASKNGQAIASIITMQFKDVLVYNTDARLALQQSWRKLPTILESHTGR